jgi:hypothetical protein
MINILFGGHYTDSLGIYRAYRTDIIKKFEIDKDAKVLHLAERAGVLIGWEPKLSIRCAKRRAKVLEIPGDESARIYGTRKMRPFRSGSIMLVQILHEIFVWR